MAGVYRQLPRTVLRLYMLAGLSETELYKYTQTDIRIMILSRSPERTAYNRSM